jgi:hypothetical protein
MVNKNISCGMPHVQWLPLAVSVGFYLIHQLRSRSRVTRCSNNGVAVRQSKPNQTGANARDAVDEKKVKTRSLGDDHDDFPDVV